jgi:hypothetical protein
MTGVDGARGGCALRRCPIRHFEYLGRAVLSVDADAITAVHAL